jgi:hypothetical protein
MLPPGRWRRTAGLGPEQKFCMIEPLARRRLVDARCSAGQNDIPEHDGFVYMLGVLAAVQEFGIEELASYEMSWRNAENREAVKCPGCAEPGLPMTALPKGHEEHDGRPRWRHQGKGHVLAQSGAGGGAASRLVPREHGPVLRPDQSHAVSRSHLTVDFARGNDTRP